MESNKKNTILVPIDFSDIANHALNHAVQVAKHFDNNLALLHVVEEAMLSSLLSFGKNDQKEELAKEAVQLRLNKISTDIKANHGIDCTTTVKFGRIYKEIAAAAEELGCDSIIMGSNGAAGLEQIIGSNASRVISHSTVPVVVVKSDASSNNYKNIVFPLDLTAESKQKVRWAIRLGKAYHSTIHIFSQKTGDKEWDNKLAANLRQIENMLEKEDIDYTEKLIEKQDGNFADQTLKYAVDINADLIMIMTQQEDKDFNEYIIGTYAQQIVNRSTKPPIMCINPHPTAFSGNWSY
jgi:nucleotide-binding universal stress UspA family protein